MKMLFHLEIEGALFHLIIHKQVERDVGWNYLAYSAAGWIVWCFHIALSSKTTFKPIPAIQK